MIAVDWSGARQGEQRHLWGAEFDAISNRVDRLEPCTRVEAVDHLVASARSEPGLVVGLDFGFSLPAWWLDHCGIAGVAELWADEQRLEGWLQECRPPFWGRPGRPRPVLADEADHWRRTERVTSPRPRSVFQIGGAGSVGTASLRGMPFLARLRATGFSVWPFDPWALPVVVEVWPRLAIGSLIKSRADPRHAWLAGRSTQLPATVRRRAGQSDDAFDAVAAVLALAARSSVIRPTVLDPLVAREGWIDGVAIPVP